MKLLADEGVDKLIVDRLRQDGHEVAYVAEMSPGIDDDTILRQANDNGALLLTLDKDFGELVFRQRLVHAGVILIRLAGLQSATKADVVSTAVAEHDTKLLNTFSVISPGSIRIRTQK